jgi:RHS repeat-associated protein
MRGFEAGLGTFEYEADPAFDPHCAPIFNPGCSLLPTRPDASTVKFYHGDHLGTTRFMTDATGAAIQSSVYSAFGMRVSGTNHRYGYDGAWGYQSHSFDEVPFGMDPDTAFPFLHVGHRYYDPSTGRFLQRDPIGIRGGTNVFTYVDNVPSRYVDPFGLFSFESAVVGFGAGAVAGLPASPQAAMICAIAGFIANGYEDGDAGRLADKVLPYVGRPGSGAFGTGTPESGAPGFIGKM